MGLKAAACGRSSPFHDCMKREKSVPTHISSTWLTPKRRCSNNDTSANRGNLTRLCEVMNTLPLTLTCVLFTDIWVTPVERYSWLQLLSAAWLPKCPQCVSACRSRLPPAGYGYRHAKHISGNVCWDLMELAVQDRGEICFKKGVV